jgi:transcriptional regulator of arginine metabolism
MKTKESRLEAIKQIITSRRVPNQEVLQDLLAERGIEVTQATLSRDLRYLRVSRAARGSEGYHYVLPDSEKHKETRKSFIRDVVRGFISLDFSGNLGVLKTIPGHANSVAFALDNLEVKGILGTMAGDDTILIVLEEDHSREAVVRLLKEEVPDLEPFLQ